MVEMGSALMDCLHPNLPHYTFVDPRRIYTTEGREEMVDQAVSIVEGFEKKGVARERIFISVSVRIDCCQTGNNKALCRFPLLKEASKSPEH